MDKKLVGLIMAGGKGERMGFSEKPLVSIAGKPMISHVIEALRGSDEIARIVVATSKNTPKTARLVKKLSLQVFNSSGAGFILDMVEAIKRLGRPTALVISADLPLVTAEILDKIIDCFRQCNRPALSVFVPCDIFSNLGLSYPGKIEIDNQNVSPVGINVLEGEAVDNSFIKQENFILPKPELAINVNDWDGLQLARKMLSLR